ncbi:FusB/FusC family EF-G-binding protein [Cohnella nanjingensis]|uniref:FusB/FusC family EF-G-binding protein n=1 Tax=Cohnella nanjingensis TaxID=1387779 RepID=A0A7X0RY94_9BACL|nr:FusB/FusC family EF-G-binding protein [Cohnella nanjingensis]MBB6674671.1 FusB/FusC family EF-G-binding protein [Cohnella nanjingensis]
MNAPFIRNHQYNLIKKQAAMVQRACNTVADPKVVESVRYSAQSKIVEALPEASEDQRLALEKIVALQTLGDFGQYLRELESDLIGFQPVTDKQIKKLFPKIKKLKVPDLAAIDLRFVTYLGWTDIATSKLFLVYARSGQLFGIEGRFTPTNKKGTCFLCNRQEEVALFSAITKSKPANASSDYYKAIGNYVCVDSGVCNRNITDVAALERFIQDIGGSSR